MSLKAGFLFVTLLLGSHAFPTPEQDMSIFFDHSEDTARIVGGSNSGRVPFMGAMVTGVTLNNLVCGGSLVTIRYFMTAAHCVLAVRDGNNLLNSLRVNVGNNRWDRGTTYRIASSIMHPNYNHNQIKNDIGFLVFTTNVALTSSVGLVTLNFNNIGAGVQARVTGWGRTRVGGSLATNLQQLVTTVIDGNRCITDVAQRAAQLNMAAPPVDPRLEICTFNANGRGTCNRDSGGPLVLTSNSQQIGLVAWGIPCARGAPDMYTRISAHRSFIEQNTR